MMKQIVEYLLEHDVPEIPKRGRKELKQIVVDGQKFRYHEDKQKTNRLTKTLNEVKQTNKYRRYALNKTKNEISEGKAKS